MSLVMDIKGIARNIIPLSTVTKKDDAKAKSKLDTDNEKEGNGQAEGENQKRRQLTPEQVQDAIQYLENLPGVKENNLSIRLVAENGITVVFIEDRDGKVVRRIPEAELYALTHNRAKPSGHLLNKAM
jgi:uncharacterized FlaG/YvyC family protein